MKINSALDIIDSEQELTAEVIVTCRYKREPCNATAIYLWPTPEICKQPIFLCKKHLDAHKDALRVALGLDRY